MDKKPSTTEGKRIEYRRNSRLRDKIQIGMRKATDRRNPIMLPVLLISAVVFFVLMFVFAMLPHSAVAVAETDYPNESVQLTFTGDTLMGRYIETIAEKDGYDSLFTDVKNIWSDSDYVFTNLEYALLVRDMSHYTPADRSIYLCASTDSVDALLDAGINVFSYANNHVGDFKAKAYLEAITWMHKNEIFFSGYNLPESDLEQYEENEDLLDLFYEFQEQKYTTLTCDNGMTVGFMALMSVYTAKSSQTNYIMKDSNSELYTYVNDCARNSDLTVVYMHAGTENYLSEDDDQTELAHNLIDAGADIVIGSHPHVLQSAERYGNGMIFYSLGNFVFDQDLTYQRDSVIVQYNIDETGDGCFELIPIRINNGKPQVTSNAYYIRRINHTLSKQLDEADYYINDSGHIVIPWTKTSY